MPRIVYVEPEKLQYLDYLEITPPDKETVDAVSRALIKLPRKYRDVALARFINFKSIKEIARETGLEEREIDQRLARARFLLRQYLAGFVSRRWHVKVRGLCRICGHPKQAAIERLLNGKPESESWGSFIRRLEKEVDERFHPPQLLINHLNHTASKRGQR